MPNYDYKCDKCQMVIEIFKKIKDLDKDEQCGKCLNILVKLPPSNTSFILKGSGWAKDGYTKS